ncbi:MAG TPA: TIGR02679 family protein [Streptosporangiaceae bacterium]|jgi:uncharacterized protein (TIGR02679 family)
MASSPDAGHVTVDRAKLDRMLGSPELSWLVERVRGRLERGEAIDGTVTLVGATPGQRRAVARLLGRNPGRGTSLSVPLPEVASELWRAAAAPSLTAAIVALGGPVRDLAAERAEDLRRWGDALSAVRASPLSQLTWYRQWLDSISRDGTVTKLIRQGQDKAVAHAVAVLERMPAGDDPGSVVLTGLAEAATGDERALTEGPVAGLVLRALAVRDAVPVPASREAEQELWNAAGVVADDLASQVLVLNVRSGGDPVGRWLTEAAEAGEPFRLTLRQLVTSPVMPWALEIFVCSSSALVRAAADQLGPACPALICTEGEPSVACARLLNAAVSSGSRLRWHGDFSWAGLRRLAAATRRLKAEPWLMTAADYVQALKAGPLGSGGAGPLKGRPEPSPWDPRLAETMRTGGRAICEERMLPTLVEALGAADSAGLAGLD